MSPRKTVVPGIRIFVPPFGVHLQKFVIAVAVFALAVIWISSVWTTGNWDWLLISGWLALILGVSLAHTIPNRLEYALARLVDRGVLVITPDQLDCFCHDLEDRVVKRWAPGFGSVVALAIIVAFVFAYSHEQLASRLPLLFAEMLGGYIVGCYLGRLACYGTLGVSLRTRGMALRIMAGHLDAVGGLKPVGEFYFYQAMVVAMPAAYLAVWLLLFPLPYFQTRYQHWQEPYAWLLALAIIFEVLAFLLPLWSFHCEMVRQKRDLLREADRLSPKIAEIQHKLGEGQASEDADPLKNTLADMTARCQAIERLPVWPVDPHIKRWFGFNNLILLMPVIGQATGLSEGWMSLLTTVFKTAAS